MGEGIVGAVWAQLFSPRLVGWVGAQGDQNPKPTRALGGVKVPAGAILRFRRRRRGKATPRRLRRGCRAKLLTHGATSSKPR